MTTTRRRHPPLLALAWLVATSTSVVRCSPLVMELVPIDGSKDNGENYDSGSAKTSTFDTVLHVTHLVDANALRSWQEDPNGGREWELPLELLSDKDPQLRVVEDMIQQTYNRLASEQESKCNPPSSHNELPHEEKETTVTTAPRLFGVSATKMVVTPRSSQVEEEEYSMHSTTEVQGRSKLAKLEIQYHVQGECQGCYEQKDVPNETAADEEEEGIERIGRPQLRPVLFCSGASSSSRHEEEEASTAEGHKNEHSIDVETEGCSSTRPFVSVSLTNFRIALQQEMKLNPTLQAAFLEDQEQQQQQQQPQPQKGDDASHTGTRLLLANSASIESVEQQQDYRSRRTDATVEEEAVMMFECNEELSVALQSTLLLMLPGDWTTTSAQTNSSNTTFLDEGENATTTTTMITLNDVEEIFLETYNGLTFDLCDAPYFRKVVNVIAEAVDEFAFDIATNTTLISFEVEAECRNKCSDTLPLFDFFANEAYDYQDLVPPEDSVTDPSVPILDTRQGTNTGPQLEQMVNGTVSSFMTSLSACSCAADSALQGEYRPPKVDEFTVAFLQAVLDAGADTSATNTTTEEEPLPALEVETVPCDGKVRSFTSYAFVELQVGSEPIKESEKLALEEAFRDIYNRLAFLNCDSFFRNILSATLEEDDGVRRRVLQEQGFTFGESEAMVMNTTYPNGTIYLNQTNSTNSNTTFIVNETSTIDPLAPKLATGALFSVVGQCRDCPVSETGSFNLFDDKFRRRRGLSHQASHEKVKAPFILPRYVPRRNIQEETSWCLCPANVTVDELSIGAFLVAFNDDIEQLQREGVLVTVGAVGELQEGQQVRCGGKGEETQTFKSTVYADVTLVLEDMSQEQQSTLETIFENSYNSMTFQLCDDKFRTIVGVNLLSSDVSPFVARRGLQIQQQGNSSLILANSSHYNATLSPTETPTDAPTSGAPSVAPSRESPTAIAGGTTVFSITGQCRNCQLTESGSFDLFNDAFRRRSLTTEAGLTSFSTRPSFLSRDLQEEGEDLCICPVGAEPGANAEGLTALTFQQIFNKKVQEERVSGAGVLNDVNVTLDNVVEGQEVECGAEIQEFTTTIYADVSLDLDDLTSQQKKILEGAFQNSYNSLAFALCDDLFRSVKNVSLEGGSARRRLQQTSNTSDIFSSTPSNAPSSSPTSSPSSRPTQSPSASPTTTVAEDAGAIFSITGQCRGCPVSDVGTFGLFDDAFRRRSLLSLDQVLDLAPRSLQDDGVACRCPAGVKPGDNGGPTSEAFQIVFNTLVEEQDENLAVQVSVDNIVEGQEVNCSSEVQLFTTTVYVDVNISGDLGNDQKAILENTFKNTYNGMAFALCDDVFRNVVDVSLDTESSAEIFSSRRLQELGNKTAWNTTNTTTNDTLLYIEDATLSLPLPQNMTSSKTTLFTVTGECRNCPVSESGNFRLFDDSFRRRRRRSLLSVDEMLANFPRNRNLQQNSSALDPNLTASCVCPIGVQPGDNDGPSAEDFRIIFNTVVEEEKTNGKLNNITVNVEELIEGAPVGCNATENTFRSEIFSDLQVNLTSLTFEEVTALEEAFQKIYNNMAFASCDQFFRTLGEVQLRIGSPEQIYPARRRLQEVGSEIDGSFFNATEFNFTDLNMANSTVGMTNTSIFENATAAPTTIPTYVGSTLFTVTGKCRNCPVTESGYFNIFDDAFRRRSLLESRDVSDFENMQRRLQGNDTCFCPTFLPDGIEYGPTAIEFEAAFIELLEEMTQEGTISSVAVTADNVVEGIEVPCDPDIREFSSVVSTDLGVDPASLTLEEIAILEESFREAYNILSFLACDGYFRLVADVEIVFDNIGDFSSRRLQDNTESTNTTGQPLFTNSTDSNSTLLNNITDAGGSIANDINDTGGAATSSSTEAQNTTATGPLPAEFRITGRCRNCPISTAGSFALFNDAFRRRSLSEPRVRPRVSLDRRAAIERRRRTQENENVNICICPPDAEPTFESTEISVGAFLDVLNAVIEEKAQEDGTFSAKKVASVAEEPRQVDVPATPQPTSATTSSSASPTVNTTTPRPTTAAPNTIEPTPDPTVAQLTPIPTPNPTGQPTPNPTPNPTGQPTPNPTPNPTTQPTPNPTAQPATSQPTPDPTLPPTPEPTPEPTLDPTQRPSSAPSAGPSAEFCRDDFFSVKAFYYVLVLGDTSELSDEDLSDAFFAGDAAVSKSLCSAVVETATVVRRISSRRRKLQSGSDSILTIQYDVTALQTDPDSTLYEDLVSRQRSLQEDSATVFAAGCTGNLTEFGVTCLTIQSGTASPTVAPTMSPSLAPSLFPSRAPSLNPSLKLSTVPSTAPSRVESIEPSVSNEPSTGPSEVSSDNPSFVPSVDPSDSPSLRPSNLPSQDPSLAPSMKPSVMASEAPSISNQPSLEPSTNPSSLPSATPSMPPSLSSAPSDLPSQFPSLSSAPSEIPSGNPTVTTDCFTTLEELQSAVLPDNCSLGSDGPFECLDEERTFTNLTDPNSVLSVKYGYPMGTWCVESITNFDFLFTGYAGPDFDLSNWKTSQVTSMQETFSDSTFNADISSWDVSAVTDFRYSFAGAGSFGGDISSWDMSAAQTLEGMLADVGSNWTSSLAGWNVSSVYDFTSMFENSDVASSVGDLKDWALIGADPAPDDFFIPACDDDQPFCENCFECPNHCFCSGRIDRRLQSQEEGIHMQSMFFGTLSIPSGLNEWDTANVVDMSSMFQAAQGFDDTRDGFNFDISGWNVELVTTAASMFKGSVGFNIDISRWKWITVSNLGGFLQGAPDFNQNLCRYNDNGSFEAQSVLLTNMFTDSGCGNTDDPVTRGGDGGPEYFGNLCFDCFDCFTNDDLFNALQPDCGECTEIEGSFCDECDCDSESCPERTYSELEEGSSTFLTYGSPPDWCVGFVTSFDGIFANYQGPSLGDLGSWRTGRVESMESTFASATFGDNISGWDTSRVFNLRYAFQSSTFEGDVSLWDTSSVETMEATFQGVTQWTSSLAGWNVSRVSSFTEMFASSDIGEGVGDLSEWRFEGASDMGAMFLRAQSLPNGLESWNTTSVLVMSSMFQEAAGFDDTRDGFSFDISGWDVRNVEFAEGMFANASGFNIDLSSWAWASAIDLSGFLEDAESFSHDLCQWNDNGINFDTGDGPLALSGAFSGTACPSQDTDPLLDGVVLSPLCFSCAGFSLSPSDLPSDMPSQSPSLSSNPSQTPSDIPSIEPSDMPSINPSQAPSDTPSIEPSAIPSVLPSSNPSESSNPSQNPSNAPSVDPSEQPSLQPSDEPSLQPSVEPSLEPSDVPSIQPSLEPSDVPSIQPSLEPSDVPSLQPSVEPSDVPSLQPSLEPSDIPIPP